MSLPPFRKIQGITCLNMLIGVKVPPKVTTYLGIFLKHLKNILFESLKNLIGPKKMLKCIIM